MLLGPRRRVHWKALPIPGVEAVPQGVIEGVCVEDVIGVQVGENQGPHLIVTRVSLQVSEGPRPGVEPNVRSSRPEEVAGASRPRSGVSTTCAQNGYFEGHGRLSTSSRPGRKREPTFLKWFGSPETRNRRLPTSGTSRSKPRSTRTP